MGRFQRRPEVQASQTPPLPDAAAATLRSALCGFYGIVNVAKHDGPDEVLALGQALLEGGAKILQLRAKHARSRTMLDHARALRELTRGKGALLCINDRVDVALAAEADAVHLGQDDLPVVAARRVAKGRLGIGVSTHSLEQVEAALGQGADYLGFGPVYSTRSKINPDPVCGIDGLAAAVVRAGRVPIVALGGITPDNARAVLRAGATGIAAIGSVIQAPDRIVAVRRLMDAFSEERRV